MGALHGLFGIEDEGARHGGQREIERQIEKEGQEDRRMAFHGAILPVLDPREGEISARLSGRIWLDPDGVFGLGAVTARTWRRDGGQGHLQGP
jgi:hypothetical protein